MLAANYAAPNAIVAPRARKKSFGQCGEHDGNLVKPGTMYGTRINEVDVRVARPFKTGKVRTTVGIDVYNVFNSAAVLTYNNTFVPGGQWLQPIAILTPSFLKLTGQIDF